MAVGPGDEVVGSVSGGCVEGAVFDLAQTVVSTGRPVLHTFGYSDSDAFAVGLTCGGEITVFVRRLSPVLGAALADVESQEPVAVATVVAGVRPGAELVIRPNHVTGSLGDEQLDAAVVEDARGMLLLGQTALRTYGATGQRRLEDVSVFIESFAPPPRMYVLGAIDFAGAVARMGKFMGYRVTVCDARPVFATRSRFPEADDVVVEWPHRFLAAAPIDDRTVIAVLTHDPKFDIPVLEVALRSSAGYVGAMGSRRTHDDRLARLRERGLTERELGRLRSPIGLDLGARTPEETAVSVAAEILQMRWGGSGHPLTDTSGAVHERRPRVASIGGRGTAGEG
jgi:xanthine dehydrogenase accessory factor